MMYSTKPAPESESMTQYSCVRLKRNVTLNPAGVVLEGTLGVVISYGPEGEVHVVEFVIAGKAVVVNFAHQLDALEPAEPPAGGLPRAGAATVSTFAGADDSAAEEDEPVVEARKLHYFALSFGHLTFVPGESVRSLLDCVYMGFQDKCVSAHRIAEAKDRSSLPSNSVLMSVNYLGYMTRDQFEYE
jgi:hypothetical protein